MQNSAFLLIIYVLSCYFPTLFALSLSYPFTLNNAFYSSRFYRFALLPFTASPAILRNV